MAAYLGSQTVPTPGDLAGEASYYSEEIMIFATSGEGEADKGGPRQKILVFFDQYPRVL